MRMLSVDTATDVCGLGLSVGGCSKLELMLTQKLTHATILLEGIRNALALAKWDLAELDALAVTRGPGSFTGLRIGISTMKGIALALDKPLIGVSSLEVLAHQAPQGFPLVCPMIDARRKEVYWSLYRRSESGLELAQPEQAGSVSEATGHIDAPCLFIGSGAALYAPKLKEQWEESAFLKGAELNAPRPGVIAHLAAVRMEQGLLEDIRQFKPVYLRKADAQLRQWMGSPQGR